MNFQKSLKSFSCLIATLSFANKIDEILIGKIIKESCRAINIYFYDLWGLFILCVQNQKIFQKNGEFYENLKIYGAAKKVLKTFIVPSVSTILEKFSQTFKHSQVLFCSPNQLAPQKYASIKKYIN